MMDARQWKSMYGAARQLTLPRPATTTRLAGAKKPTRDALLKHAAKYGWEGVEEVALEYGISGVVAPRVKRVRSTRGPSLKKRIAGYLARGMSVEAIAEAENLSPSRARRLAG
jgi:hypothetical protein